MMRVKGVSGAWTGSTWIEWAGLTDMFIYSSERVGMTQSVAKGGGMENFELVSVVEIINRRE